jgi:hypothetical protein
MRKPLQAREIYCKDDNKDIISNQSMTKYQVVGDSWNLSNLLLKLVYTFSAFRAHLLGRWLASVLTHIQKCSCTSSGLPYRLKSHSMFNHMVVYLWNFSGNPLTTRAFDKDDNSLLESTTHVVFFTAPWSTTCVLRNLLSMQSHGLECARSLPGALSECVCGSGAYLYLRR